MCLGPVMGSPGGVTRLQGTVFLLLLANFNNCLDQTVDCYTGLSKLKLKLAQEKQKSQIKYILSFVWYQKSPCHPEGLCTS